MTLWSENGNNYSWSEMDDNLCDCGSVLVCVVRGVEWRKRRGKNNLRLWEKLRGKVKRRVC